MLCCKPDMFKKRFRAWICQCEIKVIETHPFDSDGRFIRTQYDKCSGAKNSIGDNVPDHHKLLRPVINTKI